MNAQKSNSNRQRSRPVTKPDMKTKMKRNRPAMFLAIIIVLMLVFSGIYVIVANLPSGNGGNTGNGDTLTYESDYPVAIFDTTMGKFAVELYNDKVETTANNFINLVKDGFYSGLVFHRVTNLDGGQTDSAIVQGGGFDTDKNQKTSPYGTIDLEIHQELRHIDGAIAMARTTDPNSATSQFYLCDGPQDFLNDDYAVFGQTIAGMDVVRSIADVETTTKTLSSGQPMSNWPETDVIINSITIENE